MNDVIVYVLRLLLRLVWLAAGLVLLSSLVVAAMAVVFVLGLRYAWARLTGRPVTPFVFGRFGSGPGGQWGQFKSAADAWKSKAAEPLKSGMKTRTLVADVTDVESRPSNQAGQSR